ncbi:MAG: hypothetical protein KAQ94_02480 [Arcobacteraceae bacterium]|nr:hypothetical protein [Arcobacteraceae bacterium]
MRTYFKNFKDGDLTKKLSMISDISTILGVSVATFVIGPLLDKYTNFEFIISDFIISITFYFICIVIVGTSIYSIIYDNEEKEEKKSSLLSKIIQFLLLVSLISISFPYVKYITGNVFNVSYLLSAPANKAVLGISKLNIKQKKESIEITGTLNLNKEINSNDYIALIYTKNNDNQLFSSVAYGKKYLKEYEVEISKNGYFNIPIFMQYNKQEHVYLVVYRKSDWSLISSIDKNNGYPDNLTSLPHSLTDQLEAFIFDLKKYKEPVRPSEI